ncbi:unnamed protein product [Bursaphelenchus okinawaensis]|uniref:Uncharacterized protein n=1 Tax=Bursaphelenchus okinawaensis TaxID=465554 RepID=A0A811LF07_9BILA|nr:unnamed protein product [Bursaphelenchus okinawaensis]CAG9121259.1 unnamed protein product [Bursaphelenchus okinawaensis]
MAGVGEITSTIRQAAKEVSMKVQQNWSSLLLSQLNMHILSNGSSSRVMRPFVTLKQDQNGHSLYQPGLYYGYSGTYLPPLPEPESSCSATPTPQSSTCDFTDDNKSDYPCSLSVVRNEHRSKTGEGDRKLSKCRTKNSLKRKLSKPVRCDAKKKKLEEPEEDIRPWRHWDNDLKRLFSTYNVNPHKESNRYYKQFEKHNQDVIMSFNLDRESFRIPTIPVPAPPQCKAGPMYSPIVAPPLPAKKASELEDPNRQVLRQESGQNYNQNFSEAENPSYSQNQTFWTPQPFDFGQTFLNQPKGYGHQRQHSIATADPFIDFQPQSSQFAQYQQGFGLKNGNGISQSQNFIGQRQQSLPERSVPYYYVEHPLPAKHPYRGPMSTSQVATSHHRPQKKDDHTAFPSTSNTQMIQSQMDTSQMEQKKKEIYVYSSPFNLYGMAWSTRPEPENKFRLAVGSFIEEYNNKISIVQLREDVGEFKHIGTFDHPYPATKVLWIPDKKAATQT